MNVYSFLTMLVVGAAVIVIAWPVYLVVQEWAATPTVKSDPTDFPRIRHLLLLAVFIVLLQAFRH